MESLNQFEFGGYLRDASASTEACRGAGCRSLDVRVPRDFEELDLLSALVACWPDCRDLEELAFRDLEEEMLRWDVLPPRDLLEPGPDDGSNSSSSRHASLHIKDRALIIDCYLFRRQHGKLR